MRIGLISCSKKKLSHPAPARELYQPSPLFWGALRHLEQHAGLIYILSAKYGLLKLDDVVDPYDETLKDATPAHRRAWARQVLAALQREHGEDLRGNTFEFHAGVAYMTDLVPLLEAAGATCTSPVEGLRIGARLQFYATGGRADPVPNKAMKEVAATRMDHSVISTKIHVGIWLAAALLHDAGHPTFTPAQLAAEVERRFGNTRPGVKTHIYAHCIANAPKNTTVEYSYLFRTDTGDLRLFRPGDQPHPSRSGKKTAPDQVDVPEQYWDLWRRWTSPTPTR